MTCYGRTGTHSWTQEWYETRSRDAGRRARELRRQGYSPATAAMGMQVTPVGRVKMSLVSVRHPDKSPPQWPESYHRSL